MEWGLPAAADESRKDPDTASDSRSVVVEFCNSTDHELTLTQHKLRDGFWGEPPPQEIGAGTCVSWDSESDRFAQGTEGSATYNVHDIGSVEVSWDNPFVGSNMYGMSAPKGFIVIGDGGDGEDASATYTLQQGLPDVGQPEFARSAEVTLCNTTDLTLLKGEVDLPHGTWVHLPPETIPDPNLPGGNCDGQCCTWESAGSGFATGREGKAIYMLVISGNQLAGNVTVSWDVPFIGSNSYGEGAPKGFTIAHEGGEGDNAAVTFTLSPAP